MVKNCTYITFCPHSRRGPCLICVADVPRDMFSAAIGHVKNTLVDLPRELEQNRKLLPAMKKSHHQKLKRQGVTRAG